MTSLPVPAGVPRQLGLRLDAPTLRGLSPEERDAVVSVLAGLLLEAAAAPAKEDAQSYGHRKPMAEWVVVRKDRHEGYIDWVEFERTVPDLAGLADDLKTAWNAPGVIADGG